MEHRIQSKIEIITRCAAVYEKHLRDNNIMFVALKENKMVELVETLFLKENFLHLTGVHTNNKISATDFYERCMYNRLSIKDIKINDDNIVNMKLKVLPMLACIDSTANILGDFNNNRMYLQTKKMAGNVKGCIGFELYKNIFIPNTALNEDIRNLTNNRNRIVAILKKNKNCRFYDNVTYIAKNIDISKILFNDIIKNKIDFENLYSDKVNYNNLLSNL